MNRGTVCITGATSGIGREYARALARQGYAVILTGRREEELYRLVGELETPAEVLTGDLRDPSVCASLAETLSGRSDLVMLIHNAGYGHTSSFLQASSQELREMGELHVQCTVRLVRTVVPVIAAAARAGNYRGIPAVILVSSLAAFMPAPGPAMYTATKAFLLFLGQALQPDLAARGIRLQVLCPGFTHTDFHDRLEWSAERRRNRGLVRWMGADEVVRKSLRRLRRGAAWSNPLYVPGLSNRLLLLVRTLLPRRIYLFLISRFRF